MAHGPLQYQKKVEELRQAFFGPDQTHFRTPTSQRVWPTLQALARSAHMKLTNGPKQLRTVTFHRRVTRTILALGANSVDGIVHEPSHKWLGALLPQSATTIPPVPDLFLRIHGLQAAPKKKGTAVQQDVASM